MAAGLAAGPTFTVDAGRSVGKVSPTLYGLMTEEINHSYDGGLYAELIQNRAFLDDAATRRCIGRWSATAIPPASIALDPANPFNDELTTSLRLTVTKADERSSRRRGQQRLLGHSGAAARQAITPPFLPGRRPIFPGRSRCPS